MILIIRPKAESDLLALDLKKNRYGVYAEPFVWFKKLNPKITFDSNCHYLISSLQAIKFIKKKNNFVTKGNFLVIGERIRKELTSLGVKKIDHIFQDSYQLLTFLKKNKKIKRIHHLTGTINNDVLGELKKNKSIKYITTRVYEVRFKKNFSHGLARLIESKEIKSMLHYSLKASEVFYRKVRQKDKAWFKNKITHVCLSPRIGRGLKNLGVSSKMVKISKKPNYKSMMLLIKHIYNVQRN